MQPEDFEYNLISDVWSEIILRMTPEEFRSNLYMRKIFQNPVARKHYFKMNYMIPRRDGAKSYSVTIQEFISLMNEMKELGLLHPIHQNIPNVEHLISETPEMIPAYAPPGMPAYAPPGMPAYAPPGMPAYAPPGIPAFAPPGMPAYAPPGMPAYAPPGIPAFAPPGMTAYAPPGMSYFERKKSEQVLIMNFLRKYTSESDGNGIRYECVNKRISNEYLFEYVMKFVFEKYMSIEYFDPPRYGDYFSIEKYYKVIVFFMLPDNDLYSCVIPDKIVDFAFTIPFEIVLNVNYPFNYYQKLGSHICKLNIKNLKGDILKNVVMSRYDPRVRDEIFTEYLVTDIEEVKRDFPVDSITDADSSLIIFNSKDTIDNDTILKVRIGLNSFGWDTEFADEEPPSENFINTIINNDELIVHIEPTGFPDESIEYAFGIEIIPSETIQKYLDAELDVEC
jgi:hypothetical protein